MITGLILGAAIDRLFLTKKTPKSKSKPIHPESLGIPYLNPKAEKELIDNHAGLGKAITSNDVYDMITKQIIDTIDKTGHLPWYTGRDENVGKGVSLNIDTPYNFDTLKAYRGINAFMLSLKKTEGKDKNGNKVIYLDPIQDGRMYWLTFKQIEKLGGKIKKGTRSSQAIYYNFIFKYGNDTISEKKYKQLFKKYGSKNSPNYNVQEAKKLKKIPFVRYYNVFNERDITGINFEAKRKKQQEKLKQFESKAKKIKAADALFNNMPKKPKLVQRHIGSGESPHYTPNTDAITMPLKQQYKDVGIWYGTLFHESIHATGHRSRLNRGLLKDYHLDVRVRALEELVAELGSAFLNAESGIFLSTLKKNAAYIKGWSKSVKETLQENNKAIFVAAGYAQKAADYILDRDKNGTPKFYNDISNIDNTSNLEKRVIKHLEKMSHEQFANDYAYLFSADLDKVLYRIEDNNTYKKYVKLLAKKVIKDNRFDDVRFDNLKQSEQLSLFGSSGINVSTERFKKMKVSELRDFTLKYYNAKLKGNKTYSKYLNEIVFTTKAGRKISKGSAMYKEKAAVIERLEELIKKSTYNNWGDRKKADPKNLLGYLNFKSKLIIDGKKRHVRISIILNSDRKTHLKGIEVGKTKK
ncbi:zincin-like metallopeptidase domain-containing protein [Mangrovimonas cancribranchiae]|uniref:Zincin-like metallopeptidase domain-containing protein n=1 Tax=Mangrovimonas cancribranchiae TaxID=3080055 RepID=A0AAU6P5Q9_9FLAO